MFDSLAFILLTLFPLFLPVSLIAGLLRWLRQRRSEPRGIEAFRVYIFPVQFILLLAFAVFIEPALIIQYTWRITDYFWLRSLKPSEVASISIETFTWDKPAEIESLTQALNQATWYLPNHEARGPFVPMRVNLSSGKTIYLQVGQYYNRDGAIVQFFRLDKNGEEIAEELEFFIPGLPALLQQLWYLLPLLPSS